MAQNVDDVWEEWKRLTRFLECSRIAFQRELGIWAGLEVPDLNAVRVITQNGQSRFSLTASEHLEALRDEKLLLSIVLTYSYSLCEAYARLRLDLSEGARLTGGIEGWGEALLESAGNRWADVLGGRAGLIEVAVLRNFLAHGSCTITENVLNRFASAGEICPWNIGDWVSLTYEAVEIYRSRLKSLMRLGGPRPLRLA